MNKLTRFATVAGTTATTIGVLATAALATDPTTAQEALSPGADALKLALLAVAGAAVIPGVTILAVKKGWPMVKRFF
jgi:hypothetical protein